MFNSDELVCVVCCYEFSRNDRIPRVLHCCHTFCSPCLEKLSRLEVPIMTILCPLCRWITCTPAYVTLSHTLYVNTEIWSHIPDDVQQEMDQSPVWNDPNTQLESKLSHSKKSRSISALKKVLRFLKGY